DGDGRADAAVFWTGDSSWLIRRSRDGQLQTVAMAGASGLPVAADYDGDGLADPALYDRGVWTVHESSGAVRVVRFGGAAAVPVPADYDGDRRADLAVFDAG